MEQQLWEIVFAMENGQGMQAVTSETPEDLDKKITEVGDGVLSLITIHAQHKSWPIYFRVKMSKVVGWYFRPHEVFLASRGKIQLS